MRAFLVLGAAIDLLLALFLLLVFGWVMDSWRDPKGAWVGTVVTTTWSIAFLLCVGAPLLGYRLNRQRSPPVRVALAIWLPTILVVGISVAGLMLSPP